MTVDVGEFGLLPSKNESSETLVVEEIPVADGVVEVAGASPIEIDVPISQMNKRSLDRMKTYHEVLKLQVVVEEKRRQLVSISSVFEVWAEFYAIHTAQLGPMGEKISASLAAQLGTDDPEKVLLVKKEIDGEIYPALQQIQALMNDFLEKAGHKGRIG